MADKLADMQSQAGRGFAQFWLSCVCQPSASEKPGKPKLGAASPVLAVGLRQQHLGASGVYLFPFGHFGAVAP